jgi:P-type Mg2+ transporter
VPADLRLLRVDGLECDEAVLTGESLPAEKRSDPIVAPESSLDLASCAFMGTVVREGSGLGVVVCTGGRTEFEAIALQLGERQPQTAFQLGLRDFSLLLVRVTAVLAGSILVINVVLGRSSLGSVLFALAIAVGLTPQLLPAIVTISLSTGAKRLAQRKVGLVSIEDLGNIVVLFTDKTGTLTEGQITFAGLWTPRVGHRMRSCAPGCSATTRASPTGRWSAATSSIRRCGRRRVPAASAPSELAVWPICPSTTSGAWHRSLSSRTASGR